MTPLFNKLNWKGQQLLHILQPPADLEAEWNAMRHHVTIQNKISQADKSTFLLAFCTNLQQVEEVAKWAAAALEADGLLWIAYPKQSSKKYTCSFNRDTGWASLGAAGFEPVRQVAVDADWSALRFRRVEFIKTMTRSFALTDAGKKKAAANKNK